MAFENYVKLAGSERQPMAGAKKTAAADPNARHAGNNRAASAVNPARMRSLWPISSLAESA